jgi:isocitrate dehydrogenase kinase/phosphatase
MPSSQRERDQRAEADASAARAASAASPRASADGSEALAERTAACITAAFEDYHEEFRAITRRARTRFETADWQGIHQDAAERVDLHSHVVTRAVAALRSALGPSVHDKALWAQARAAYTARIAGSATRELAETFFSSSARRVFATVGVDPTIQYVDSDLGASPAPPLETIFRRYPGGDDLGGAVRALLADVPLGIPWEDLERDARLVAAEIAAQRRADGGGQAVEAIEALCPLFFRNKGAYLVGRIRGGDRLMPLVLALLNVGGRVMVDAALLTEDEASIVFSFTHSYFHADVEAPHATIQFLTSIMPLKRVAELYMALGYNKHGKTELYRGLLRHLERSRERFEIAPGDPGMVMLVFTLPGYDLVFKVIRDAFAPPKTTTRRDVLEKYQLVFHHDRAGRLADAQEFEGLAFPRERFTDALLEELLATAGSAVSVGSGEVVIKHLYTQRRMIPFNLFLRDASPAAARHAALDYGQTIKDLASTNIFPGDLLLKNFGVTRHGRIVFYDYDELCLLTDCTFRWMPEPRDVDEEMAAEPWFYVGERDMFPEEFIRFMGLLGETRETFVAAHGDLLTPEYWCHMQARHQAGEVIDIFPYRASRRLGRSRSS